MKNKHTIIGLVMKEIDFLEYKYYSEWNDLSLEEITKERMNDLSKSCLEIKKIELT